MLIFVGENTPCKETKEMPYFYRQVERGNA